MTKKPFHFWTLQISKSTFIAALHFHTPPLSAAESTEKAPILLKTGEQKVITVGDYERFSLGSNIVRGYSVSTQSVIIKGIHPGETTLIILKKQKLTEIRKIRVEKDSFDPTERRLYGLSEGLHEVEVKLWDKQMWIRGTVSSFTELQQIGRIHESGLATTHIDIDLSQTLESEVRQKLNPLLEKHSLTLSQSPNEWSISGVVENTLTKDKILKALRKIHPMIGDQIECFSGKGDTLYFQVYLLELEKSSGRTLGMQWPEEQSMIFQARPLALTKTDSLLLNLKALEKQGKAKILSQPEIAVQAPGEAELFSGGELPIRTQSRFYSGVQWKNFGLLLKLKVNEATSRAIRLDIQTEMSHLDAELSKEDAPALQSNRMKTTVQARFSEPLLLSGLITERTQQQIRGIPVLKSIPFFGKLFSSESYIQNRSELMAILIPRLTPPNLQKHRRIFLPKGPLPELQSGPVVDQDNTNLDPWSEF